MIIKSMVRKWLGIVDKDNYKSLTTLINNRIQLRDYDADATLREVIMVQQKLDYLLNILGIEIAVDTESMPPKIDVAHTRVSNLVEKAEEIAGASVDIREFLTLQRRLLVQQHEILSKARYLSNG